MELGFGLGTSFRVTAQAALAAGVSLEFCSLERAPVAPAYIEGEDAGARLARRALDRLMRSGHAEAAVEEGPISLRVVVADWLDDWRWFPAHAVYFDPFGPRVEPESWTLSCFERARSCMGPEAILSTYSAAGQVRRNMAAAGLYVATAPGPTFKREITLASASPAVLATQQVVKRPAPKRPE